MLSASFELSYGDDPEADPEFLRDSVSVLESVCVDLAERYEAYSLPSAAEELTLVFGYPQAQEDDARRAVAAGLALINEARNMSESQPGQEARAVANSVRTWESSAASFGGMLSRSKCTLSANMPHAAQKRRRGRDTLVRRLHMNSPQFLPQGAGAS